MISYATMTSCSLSANGELSVTQHMLLALRGSFQIALYLLQGIARLSVFAEELINRLKAREKQQNLPQSGI